MVFSQNSENKKLRKSESPEVPKGTLRDCKQSPRSRASPDFGSSPIQKEFLASMYKGKHIKKDRGLSDHLVGFLCLKCLYQVHCDPMLPDTSPAVGIVFPL